MKKTCIIGHFGFGQNLLNGQTVKTKIITAEVEKHIGRDNLMLVDLAGGIRRIPRLLRDIPHELRTSDNMVIMPVENGLRFLTPLLDFWNRFYHRKLHYVVIGGWLPQFLARRPLLAAMLKRFDGIYVETHTMKKALEAHGFSNILIMPNGKRLTILSESDLIYPKNAPYKLCTFSRVMREKGIEDAVNAVQTANHELGYPAYTLDIYGPVDAGQTEWFEHLKRSFPEYIQYRGAVPYEETPETLNGYFALLFPTRFYTEGIPGTIIDAYSAGVPVIAAKWESYADVINENVGIVYIRGDQSSLVRILKAAATQPEILLEKKKLCLREAEKYRIETTVNILLNQLDNDKL